MAPGRLTQEIESTVGHTVAVVIQATAQLISGSGCIMLVYGAASSIVIVLLWVYYSSQVLLFGAVFTRVYAKHRGAPLEPKEHAMRVTQRARA